MNILFLLIQATNSIIRIRQLTVQALDQQQIIPLICQMVVFLFILNLRHLKLVFIFLKANIKLKIKMNL